MAKNELLKRSQTMHHAMFLNLWLLRTYWAVFSTQKLHYVMWAERHSASCVCVLLFAMMPVIVWLINLPTHTVKIKRIIHQYLLTWLPILICLCIFKTDLDSLTHSHREKKRETLLTFYCLGNSMKDIVTGHSCNNYLENYRWHNNFMVWEICYTSGNIWTKGNICERTYLSMYLCLQRLQAQCEKKTHLQVRKMTTMMATKKCFVFI